MNRTDRRPSFFIPRGVRPFLFAWYVATVAFALVAIAAAALA